MNQKCFSFVFSALLASTLVHELRAKSFDPSYSESLKAVCRAKRASDSAGLTLQAFGDVLAISNSSAHVALLIDGSSGLFALLNGSSGAGLIGDIANNTGVIYHSGLWNADEESLKDYVNSLPDGLAGLLNGGDEKIDLSDVPEEILEAVADAVATLVGGLPPALLADLGKVLDLVVELVAKILELLGGVLGGLLKAIGDLVIDLVYPLQGLLTVLGSLGKLIATTGKTLADLLEGADNFNIDLILGAPNGLAALVEIILQLGGELVSEALAAVVGTVENLAELIHGLGGDVTNGITGVFGILEQILAAIGGEVTDLVDLINALIEYVISAADNRVEGIADELNSTLHDLLDAIDASKGTDILADLVGIVEGLLRGTLEAAGVNLAAIVNDLLSVVAGLVENLLALVVKILVAVLDTVEGLVQLILNLLIRLITPAGVESLIGLGLDIDVSQDNLLEHILSSVDDLVQLLLGNVYEALSGLPVIGDILKAVSEALEKATGENLEDLLNGTDSFANLIKALLQLVTGIVLDVPAAALLLVRDILQAVQNLLGGL